MAYPLGIAFVSYYFEFGAKCIDQRETNNLRGTSQIHYYMTIVAKIVTLT